MNCAIYTTRYGVLSTSIFQRRPTLHLSAIDVSVRGLTPSVERHVLPKASSDISLHFHFAKAMTIREQRLADNDLRVALLSGFRSWQTST